VAIDLANRAQLIRNGSPHDDRAEEPAEPSTVTPGEELLTEQLESLELGVRSALGYVDPRYVAGDPAAWASDLGYALDRVAVRLDARPSEELVEVGLTHADPMMREQALFEYADRNEGDAIAVLAEAVRRDRDQQVRWAALWAIEKLGGVGAATALRQFRDDDDPEIAEWATLFANELRTGDPEFDARACRGTPGRTFDETIFLLIHCDLYVRLADDNTLWGKLSLAPQGLARVYGQAHACPNVATRERQLVIAKQIQGLHADGSPHIDNYLFRGFTDRTRSDRGHFFFESHVKRPFYVSGHADDASEGVRETHIGFMREGCWHLDSRFKIGEASAIRYVRGRFQGWGYVNLERVGGKPIEEMLTPGNAILSTLHDPVAGPLTNAFILGTFKGKLNDWDGDGHIDLNSRDVYSTVDGEIDTDMDGVPDEPGSTCCGYRSPLP
jgi:HEAT repeats